MICTVCNERNVFAHGKCRTCISDKNNPRSTRKIKSGYVYILLDGSWIAEHRHIMSQHIGRDLHDDEIVYHINGDKHDNRIENLSLRTYSTPPGNSIEEALSWADDIIARYRP